MTNTPTPKNPLEFQEWVDQLAQKWQTGLIPDPQTVAVILINYRDEVLLQLSDNNPKISFANSWTLPGGVVEANEIPEQAVRRELAWEQGFIWIHWKTYKRKSENRRLSIEQHIYIGKTREGNQ